jgi:ribonuclease E
MAAQAVPADMSTETEVSANTSGESLTEGSGTGEPGDGRGRRRRRGRRGRRGGQGREGAAAGEAGSTDATDASVDDLDETSDDLAEDRGTAPTSNGGSADALLDTLPPPPREASAYSWTGLAAPEAASAPEPATAAAPEPVAAAVPAPVADPVADPIIDGATPAAALTAPSPAELPTETPTEAPAEPTPAAAGTEPSRVVWSSSPTSYGASTRRDDY